MAVLWGVQVDAFCRCVTYIPSYGDSPGLKVNILPLEGAALTPPNTRVNQQVNQGLPFYRFLLQTGYNFLNLW